MLACLDFILTQITNFMRMLFTIDVDNNLSLGLVLCLAFIFLPMMLRIINFIKQDAIEELDDKYDESRPINTTSMTLTERTKLGNGRSTTYSNSVSRRRRMR